MPTSMTHSDAADHSLTPAQRPDDLATHAHRQLIGYVGLTLPVVLVAIAGVRSTQPADRWAPLDSISAYYYSGAVAAFVGLLVALALFLFSYDGYKNKYQWADRLAAITAGVAALGVAFFPTEPSQGVPAESWWSTSTGVIHYVSAAVLFLAFAVFSLVLFRLNAAGETIDADKRWRNRIYLVCGLVILGSIIWTALNGRARRPIFLPESIALIAFAVSWLVKGYALRTITGAVRAIPSAVKDGLKRSQA